MCDANHLLLFTRFPEPGITKTRLIPKLGAEGAANLHKTLTERIISEMETFQQGLHVTTTIHFTGGDCRKMEAWLGPRRFCRQVEGNLGLRMQKAFESAFAKGATRAVLIGSDIPDLSATILADAFVVLQDQDVVFGPSRDGGYYLIGLQKKVAERLYPLAFQDITWSTSTVLAETCSRLSSELCTIGFLPVLRDIDTADDLPWDFQQSLTENG